MVIRVSIQIEIMASLIRSIKRLIKINDDGGWNFLVSLKSDWDQEFKEVNLNALCEYTVDHVKIPVRDPKGNLLFEVIAFLTNDSFTTDFIAKPCYIESMREAYNDNVDYWSYHISNIKKQNQYCRSSFSLSSSDIKTKLDYEISFNKEYEEYKQNGDESYKESLMCSCVIMLVTNISEKFKTKNKKKKYNFELFGLKMQKGINVLNGNNYFIFEHRYKK